MKKRFTAVLSILLAFTLIFTSACSGKKDGDDATDAPTDSAALPTYTEKPGSVTKNETVFVNLDNNGTPTLITVSDWLHTDKGEVHVKDKSDLQGIVNAKGDEEPIINGESLEWNMGSTDLYYRGTSNKELPVSISIKYFLDGTEVKAEDLKGKSGNVDIKISFKNNLSTTKTVNGKSVTVYSPFLVVGGFILPEDKFSAITVSNGTSVGDGSKQIAVIAALPGLSETLGLESLGVDTEKAKLGSEFTISAKAEDFSLGNMYFAAMPFSDLDTKIELPGSVSNLETDLNKIKSLINSVYSMDPEKLLKMLSSNEKGIEELSSSITKAAKLYEENKELISVLKKYLTEENVEKLKKLTTDLSEADLAQYKELLSNPLFKRFFKDLPKLAEDLEDVMPIVEALEKDLDDPEVKASLDKLPETLTELNDIIGTISDNQELIDSLLELTSDNNMSKISDILDAVNKYDISSMISEYTKLADNAEDVSAKLEAMISLGGEYKIFTSAESDMKTTTAFVFNTPSIK